MVYIFYKSNSDYSLIPFETACKYVINAIFFSRNYAYSDYDGALFYSLDYCETRITDHQLEILTNYITNGDIVVEDSAYYKLVHNIENIVLNKSKAKDVENII